MGVESGEQDHKHEMRHVIRHYCKVCNRGFGCAGALGGHMRAHVMGDVVSHDDQNLRTKSLQGSNHNKKHSYFLRAKTPRFMGYRLSDDHGDGPSANSSEEEDLANCLVMLSNYKEEENNIKAKQVVVEKGMFQCKACKKVFNSHQALGGHRASHKKVKGCFAAKFNDEDDDDDNNNGDEDAIQEDHHGAPTYPSPDPSSDTNRPTSNRKIRPKMHECSVCRRVFSSGQALGGHKRCHWLTTSTGNAFIPNFQDFQYDHQQLYKKPMLTKPPHHQLDLNLNLPAPQPEGDSDNTSNNRFEASTRLYLQQWANQSQLKIENGQKGSCEMKLRKLSDPRDLNLDGGWLQMGIASTTEPHEVMMV